MRSPPERDQQTVAIGTALGVFAVVLGGMVLARWLTHAVSGAADAHTDGVLGAAAVVLASASAIVTLVRSRRG